MEQSRAKSRMLKIKDTLAQHLTQLESASALRDSIEPELKSLINALSDFVEDECVIWKPKIMP